MGRSFKECVKKSRQHKKIIVTGPQRSGTTFTAKILAKELGYKHIDELDFGVTNTSEWQNILDNKENFVMQCPHFAKEASHLEDVFVVFMIRDIEDIKLSQKRINWQCEGVELKKYDEDGDIAQVKYNYWHKNKPKHYFELKYESLASHPSWKPKEQRKNFHSKQTY